jgi:hypothetical protein
MSTVTEAQDAAGKGPLLQRLLAPVLALVLCLAAFVLPWFSVPLFGELGWGTLQGIFSLVSLFFGAELDFDGGRTLEALGEVVGSFSLLSVVVGVVVTLLSIALVLTACVLAIVACFRGPISGAGKGIVVARVSFLLLALALVLDGVFVVSVDAYLAAQVLSILQTFGGNEGTLSFIRPSAFAWLLLATSAACRVIFGVIKRKLRLSRELRT